MTDPLPRARAIHLGARRRPATPPRPVPWLLASSLRLRGWDVQLSWLLTVLGMAACLVIVPRVELDPHRYSHFAMATVTTLTNDTVTYVYTDHHGVQHRSHQHVNWERVRGFDTTIEIHFDPDDPARSVTRVREDVVGPGSLALLAFPGGALVLAILFMVLRRQRITLLRFGCEARGQIVHTPVLGDLETLLTYDHQLDGDTRTIHVGFARPGVVDDEANVPVIYDPSNPDDAIALDELSGRPRIRDGRVVTTERISLAPFLLPAVTLAAAITLVIKTV